MAVSERDQPPTAAPYNSTARRARSVTPQRPGRPDLVTRAARPLTSHVDGVVPPGHGGGRLAPGRLALEVQLSVLFKRTNHRAGSGLSAVLQQNSDALRLGCKWNGVSDGPSSDIGLILRSYGVERKELQ